MEEKIMKKEKRFEMKKFLRRFIPGVMALAMVLSATSITTGSAKAAYDTWSWGQEKAHEAADLVRNIGGLRYAANAALSAYWYSEGGRNTSRDYYYDSYNNQRTYADGTTTSGDGGYSYGYNGYNGYSVLDNGKGYIASDGNYVFADGSYYDGQYIWHWSNSNSRYYRLTDESARTWGSRTRYNTSGGGNGNQQGNQGNNNYCGTTGNYSSYYYNNKQLYSGRIITGVESYASKSDAELLARLILSYTAGKDLQTKSAAGWMFLNSKGNSNLSAILPYYPAYVSDISLTTSEGKEAVNLAYDLFFRLSAENAGNTYVGRTLPKGYVYYLIDGSGNIYFRNSANGTNYTFPASGTWSQYHNPY